MARPNIGILAHNTGAGAVFDQLDYDDKIKVVYSDNSVIYRVSIIERYKANEPLNPYSYFTRDGVTLSADELFRRIYYPQDNRLVTQTCFDGSNGRLFIIAFVWRGIDTLHNN
jgi:hypothetical protein